MDEGLSTICRWRGMPPAARPSRGSGLGMWKKENCEMRLGELDEMRGCGSGWDGYIRVVGDSPKTGVAGLLSLVRIRGWTGGSQAAAGAKIWLARL